MKDGYCPACLGTLSPNKANCKAIDFVCTQCAIPFQLKSTKSRIGPKVPDGSYDAMVSAIRSDASPALMLLRYELSSWEVHDLFVIPSFALPEQAIIRRRPLGPLARRAGWVGCNIDLNLVALEARVPLVSARGVVPKGQVAAQYARLRPLKEIASKQRGWTLAVLNAIQSRLRERFSTVDAYSIEPELTALFPGNKNVRPKIRQQLQVLRDIGILEHTERGWWRLTGIHINN